MDKILDLMENTFDRLNSVGEIVPLLLIRLFLAWEFFEAGVEKFRGQNWFSQVQDKFPVPFNLVPADFSWLLATWTELAGAVALALGFATRFTALSLIILDLVAWYSIHAGSGYNVCSNGFKLPLIYLLMLLTLFFMGPGRASIDAWLARKYF